MWQNQQNRNQQSDYDRANLLTNVTILSLTIGLFYFNRWNVALNARNVQLNAMNVISNRRSAESGKQTLEVLKEINNKIK